MKKIISLLVFSLLAGCFQAFSGDDDLRTVPVTNNPTIIPNHGPIPGIPTAPY